ncbi:MAG: protein kinase [bacterium]
MLVLNTKHHKDLIIMIIALGDAYLEKGLYAEAAKRYRQLLDFKVANKHILTNLSKAFIGLKKVDAFALEVYQKAVQYDPRNSEIFDILASTFLKEGRDDEHAIEIYEKALRPNSLQLEKLVHQLGTIYFRKQKFEPCKKVNELLLIQLGFNAKALALFLKSCWNLSLHNDAIVMLKKLIDRTEGRPELLRYLCLCYLEKKFSGDLNENVMRFNHVDRQLVSDYLTTHSHFQALQELDFFLSLKRFYLAHEYWGFVEPSHAEEPQNALVLNEAKQPDYSAKVQSRNAQMSFNIYGDLLAKLSSFESLTGRTLTPRSSLTYEDFQKEGAAIFVDPNVETSEVGAPRDADILTTIRLCDWDSNSMNDTAEIQQTGRERFFAFIIEYLEKYQLYHSWAISDGVLIFSSNIFQTVAMSVEMLNTLSRNNLQKEPHEAFHIAIGIHHSRHGFGNNSVNCLKELSTSIKLATVNQRDLAERDHPTYAKSMQKKDRIFLSSKAYREIKNANKFKINSLGQLKLKYMQETLSLHEIVWRNPIEDLNVGFIRKLGRFDLLAEIGNKQAIRVFKAKDSMLQRFVILKVIQSEAFNSLPANSPQKLQFYESAKMLGRLHHPNIANIYEVDEDQALTYLAREFIEGVPVTALYSRGKPFQADRFIKIIYQICRGLQYSHRLDCFHLNLKPNNIFIGVNDEVKMTDFRIPGQELWNRNNTQLNYEDCAYMAPELIHGRQGDARSDVFSLGILLYQIATGTHPFTGSQLSEVTQSILNRKPASPKLKNDKLPKFCEAFIMKCLVKNPENRFQSFDEMVTVLKKTFETKLFSNFNYQIAQSRDSY